MTDGGRVASPVAVGTFGTFWPDGAAGLAFLAIGFPGDALCARHLSEGRHGVQAPFVPPRRRDGTSRRRSRMSNRSGAEKGSRDATVWSYARKHDLRRRRGEKGFDEDAFLPERGEGGGPNDEAERHGHVESCPHRQKIQRLEGGPSTFRPAPCCRRFPAAAAGPLRLERPATPKT